MKMLRISILNIVVILMLVSCASGPPSYELNIHSAISGRGSVNIRQSDTGVVVLTGWVEDAYSRAAVERAALQGEHVTQVINLIELPWR